ncbi:MAG: tRNA 2-selenouridine(34) synthase MnmH [Bdellovibrionales bacterium]
MDEKLKTTFPQISNWALTHPQFLDVRAPVEFAQGHLPGAINVPLLNDEERALVGTCYKEKGQTAAIELGHQLVAGMTKQKRLEEWQNLIQKNPHMILYCFRGGLRSQTVQRWLKELGLDVIRLKGGYKEARSQILTHLSELVSKQKIILISGPTGSGKTHFLKSLDRFWPQVDLEELAKHKGSAFGKRKEAQPSQATFENLLVLNWLEQFQNFESSALPLALEDESRLIGRMALPDLLFTEMRKSSIVWLDVDLEDRVSQIFSDYIEQTEIVLSEDISAGLQVYQSYKKALLDIQKRLGGARTSEVMSDLEKSEKLWLESKEKQIKLELLSNREWIKKLLIYYYDPMYLGSLEKRNPKVYFRGSPDAARAFLLEEKNKIKATPVSKKAPTD